MRFLVTVTIALLASPLPLTDAAAQQSPPTLEHRLADGFQRNLDHIENNAALARPDQSPTTIGEDEVNDYAAAGRIKVLAGVKKVTFQFQPRMITAHAIPDFRATAQGALEQNLTMFKPKTADFRYSLDWHSDAERACMVAKGATKCR